MLSRGDIANVVRTIADALPAEKIVLFGSYARGEETDQSDVDLLVVVDLGLPPHRRFAAVRRLLAAYPAAFDIIVKTPAEYRASRNMLNHIVYFADKYGVVVHERDVA